MKINYKHRNLRTLLSFVAFCYKNPQLRFWQALASWSGYWKIRAEAPPEDTKYGRTPQEISIDTFHWEGRTHNDV